MFYYFIFIIFVYLSLSFKDKKKINIKPNMINYIGLILIVLFSVFRYDVGADYPSYYMSVNNPIFSEDFEFLSLLIVQVARYFNYPPLLFILFGLITYYCFFKTMVSYSQNLLLSVLIYLSFFYFTDLSIIRQATAVSITFYGFKYIKDKKLIKYILTCIFAFLFHESALIAIPIYFIFNYLSFKITIILSLGIYLSFSIIGLLLNYYDYFYSYILIKDVLDKSGNIIKYIFLIIFVLMFLYDRISSKNKNRDSYYSVIIFGLLSFLLLGGHVGYRVGEYFLIYFILLIPLFFHDFKLYYLKQIYIFFSILFFSYTPYYNFSVKGSKSDIVPYQSVLIIDEENTPFRIYKF